jgi:predicted transcriptional regulator
MRWFYRISPAYNGIESMSQGTGAFAQAPKSTESTSERFVADEASVGILKVLARRKSIPYLELTFICNVSEDKLAEVIRNLEDEEIVRVTCRGDITEEIVTLKQKGFDLVSSLSF